MPEHGEQTFTNRDLMRECQSEVGYRRWVYGKKVAEGKMSQGEADRKIAMMEWMALHFGELAQEEEHGGELFPDTNRS